MIVGHVLLRPQSDESIRRMTMLVEWVDHLAIRQHILTSDIVCARRVQSFPHATTGPIVRSPVIANCLMPKVDIVHAHDARGGQVGLLMALTRSVPFVVQRFEDQRSLREPFRDMILRRAGAVLDRVDDVERLIETYRRVVDGAPVMSELPKYSDRRQ